MAPILDPNHLPWGSCTSIRGTNLKISALTGAVIRKRGPVAVIVGFHGTMMSLVRALGPQLCFRGEARHFGPWSIIATYY